MSAPAANTVPAQATVTTHSSPVKEGVHHSTSSSSTSSVARGVTKRLTWLAHKKVQWNRVQDGLAESEARNHMSNGGPAVLRLEQQARRAFGIADQKAVIAINNGSSAIHAIVSALNLWRGRTHKFATQSFTFPASAQASCSNAVIVDIDAEGGLDLNALKPDEIDGIIVTNCFGHLTNIAKYEEWATTNGKILIFDNAATSNSIYSSSTPGSATNSLNFGHACTVSFHHTKPCGFGEGGLIVCDPEWVPYIRQIMNFGYDVPKGNALWHREGNNFKMADVAATFISAYLQDLPYIMEQHTRVYSEFDDWIKTLDPPVKMFPHRGSGVPFVSCLPLLFSAPVSEALVLRLASTRNMDIRKYYKPLDPLAPVSADLYGRIMCLPCHVDMGADEIERCKEVVLEVQRVLCLDADAAGKAEHVAAPKAPRSNSPAAVAPISPTQTIATSPAAQACLAAGGSAIAAERLVEVTSRSVVNVLVWPCGSGIGQEIHAALHVDKGINLIGASEKSVNAGQYLFSQFYDTVPHMRDVDACLAELNRIIDAENIHVIFPAFDDIIVFLSAHRARLHATLITSSDDIAKITRSKSRTYDALEGAVPLPKRYAIPASVTEGLSSTASGAGSGNAAKLLPVTEQSFPLFMKPDAGSSAIDARLVKNMTEVKAQAAAVPSTLLLEYLPGPDEYTVDCFSDRERGVLFARARVRDRAIAGLAVATHSVDIPEIEDYARRIWAKIPFNGAWFFQVRRSASGILTLLEAAPRIAGAMALYRAIGVNFPLLAVYEAMRFPIRIEVNNHPVSNYKIYQNHYKTDLKPSTVYVDYDDTLVLRTGALNLLLLRYLYQCINDGVRLVLITRNAHMSRDMLQQRRVNIFDEVIVVPVGAKKSGYIPQTHGQPKAKNPVDTTPVFIDDSFREREDVRAVCGLHVFAPDAVEALIVAQ